MDSCSFPEQCWRERKCSLNPHTMKESSNCKDPCITEGGFVLWTLSKSTVQIPTQRQRCQFCFYSCHILMHLHLIGKWLQLASIISVSCITSRNYLKLFLKHIYLFRCFLKPQGSEQMLQWSFGFCVSFVPETLELWVKSASTLPLTPPEPWGQSPASDKWTNEIFIASHYILPRERRT